MCVWACLWKREFEHEKVCWTGCCWLLAVAVGQGIALRFFELQLRARGRERATEAQWMAVGQTTAYCLEGSGESVLAVVFFFLSVCLSVCVCVRACLCCVVVG